MSREKTFRIAVRNFPPFETAIDKSWAQFKEARNLDMELDAVSMDLHPLEESLFDKNGLKNGDWDVAFLPTDWVANAHESQSVVDLAPLIAQNSPDEYPDNWTDSLLRMQRFGDVVIGLPYHDGPEVFIYRKDLFEDPAEQQAYHEKYGQDLKVPETWDEFHQIAQFFQRPDDGLSGTVFAAYPDGHNTVYDFCLQLWTHGGELTNDAGEFTLNTPEAAQALEFYRKMLNDEGAVHPKARELDSVKSGFALAHGEVAMMVNWFGFAVMCDTIPDSKVKGKLSIAPIPHAPEKPTASLNVYWILAIAAGSPHQALAYDFLRYCASAPVDKMLTLGGATGCRKSTWFDDEVNEIVPYYHKLETLHENARELPRLANWNSIASVIDELMLGAMNTQEPIADLLAAAQSKV